MAVKTFYLKSASNAQGYADLADGTTQAAANSPHGWVPGTAATGKFPLRSGSQSTTVDATQPDGSIDTTNKDAIRSEAALTGTFASGNWVFTFSCTGSVAAGSIDGRILFRLFKSANADGTSATEITAGIQTGSTITNISSSADTTTSALTINPGAITLSSEYLFVQVAWEQTGAGGMSTSNVLLRTGSSSSAGTRIATTDFTAGGGGGGTAYSDTITAGTVGIVGQTIAPIFGRTDAITAGTVGIVGQTVSPVFAITGTITAGTVGIVGATVTPVFGRTDAITA